MIKHFLYMAAFAGVSYYVVTKLVDKAQPAAGVRSVDTKGREIIFKENKNGYLQDQYGGIWA